MLRVLAEALVEAIEAADWYDRRRLGLGDEFLDEIELAFNRIRADRESFPRWEWYSGPELIRRCRIRRFP